MIVQGHHTPTPHTPAHHPGNPKPAAHHPGHPKGGKPAKPATHKPEHHKPGHHKPSDHKPKGPKTAALWEPELSETAAPLLGLKQGGHIATRRLN